MINGSTTRKTSSALKLIQQNSEAVLGTFMHELHEKQAFSPVLLRKLIDAIHTLSKQRPKSQELRIRVFHIYDYVVRSAFMSYFDPRDRCKLKGVRTSNWQDQLEQLWLAVHDYLFLKNSKPRNL